MIAAVARARTLLFVPGHRSDRFARAAASGADLVVLDLEDAVPPADKASAREAVARALAGLRSVVRINAANTAEHSDDLAALAGLGARAAVMVPKADAGSLAGISAALPGTPLLPLVETAVGLRDLREIASAPGVVRLAFGSLDLAAELGTPIRGTATLDWARSQLVVASAAAGLPGPIDGVTPELSDEAVLRADTAAAQALGCTARLCIHPAQVPVVADLLAPTAAELSWAECVLETLDDSGVAVLDGRMVDRPVVERARRILAASVDQAGATE